MNLEVPLDNVRCFAASIGFAELAMHRSSRFKEALLFTGRLTAMALRTSATRSGYMLNLVTHFLAHCKNSWFQFPASKDGDISGGGGF